jgi:uncharacterized protein
MAEDEKQKVLRDLREKMAQMLGRPLHASEEPRTEPCEIDALLPGRTVVTPVGTCFISEREMDLSEFHGKYRLREYLDAELSRLNLLIDDPRLAKLDPVDGLFLDTETTGLSAYEGAFAFMVGLGYFRGGKFVSAQLFCRDYQEEPACLTELVRLASERSFLVTFNGKNFDVPLLTVRLAVNRIEHGFAEMPHIDLLFPSRRLWKWGNENCRLGTMENEVLGLTRHGDVPGFEIPDLYMDYLSERDARKLLGVFEHNHIDVVSMVVLLARATRLLGASAEDLITSEEAYGLGRIRLNRGELEPAAAFFEKSLAGLSGELLAKALRDTALIFRRWKRYDDAAPLWARLIEIDPEHPLAYEQLAIYHERHSKRPAEALRVVEQAQRNVLFSGWEQKKALEKRRARLLGKLEKT